MKHLFQILPFFFVTICFDASGCSCISLSTFCEAVNRAMEFDPLQTLVVRGKKIGEKRVNSQRTDMIFAVEESFVNTKGIMTLRIQDGNGANCVQGVTQYKRGDELIIIAYITKDPETSELVGNISSCGPPPLTVNGNKVTGAITSDMNSISLSRFREMGTCGINPFKFVLRNPQNERRVFLDILNGPEVRASIRVHDYLGKLLYNEFLLFDGPQTLELSTGQWPPGIYVLCIRSEEKSTALRFLVT